MSYINTTECCQFKSLSFHNLRPIGLKEILYRPCPDLMAKHPHPIESVLKCIDSRVIAFRGRKKPTKLEKIIKNRYFIYKLSNKISTVTKRQFFESRLLPDKLIGMFKEIKTADHKSFKLELVTVLKQFLDRKHIQELIETHIQDKRDRFSVKYSKHTIILAALSIFIFRMGSGNKYEDSCRDEDKRYGLKNMSTFIDNPEAEVPAIKTIENFLKQLDDNCINDLMINFFKYLVKSKFFALHPQILLNDIFVIAADCVHVHSYENPHHVDKDGNLDCPCYLKRVYNKGKENEKVKWVHNILVYSFVFCGGLQIPIYYYPIKAKQITCLESESDEDVKQECETIALKNTLPIIREAFPNIKIMILLDGLYANKPIIKLLKDHRCEYAIVRKDKCLTSLKKECDKLSENENHRKNCTKKSKIVDKNGHTIEEEFKWFNGRYLGDDLYTNVLRYSAKRTINGVEEVYTCEWLVSWILSAKNCERTVKIARSRWRLEDTFNSLKNRGYEFKHDYSRDPRSCFKWHGLALFVSGIFDLFQLSDVVQKRKGDSAQSTFASDLLAELLQKPTHELFSSAALSKKIQFRYNFAVEVIKFPKIRKSKPPNLKLAV